MLGGLSCWGLGCCGTRVGLAVVRGRVGVPLVAGRGARCCRREACGSCGAAGLVSEERRKSWCLFSLCFQLSKASFGRNSERMCPQETRKKSTKHPQETTRNQGLHWIAGERTQTTPQPAAASPPAQPRAHTLANPASPPLANPHFRPRACAHAPPARPPGRPHVRPPALRSHGVPHQSTSLRFPEHYASLLGFPQLSPAVNELQHGKEHMTSQFKSIHGAEHTETEHTCKLLNYLRMSFLAGRVFFFALCPVWDKVH